MNDCDIAICLSQKKVDEYLMKYEIKTTILNLLMHT